MLAEEYVVKELQKVREELEHIKKSMLSTRTAQSASSLLRLMKSRRQKRTSSLWLICSYRRPAQVVRLNTSQQSMSLRILRKALLTKSRASRKA